MSTSRVSKASPYRRWLRFRLRTLLFLMLVLGLALYALRQLANEASRQRQLVANLEADGWSIHSSSEEPWIWELLDVGYRDRVESVSLSTGSAITDISPVEEFANLEVLIIFYSEVADIAPLAGLEKLRYLDITSTRVTDLSPLAHLENITELNVSFTEVADVSCLAGMKNLKILDLRGTNVNQRQIDELQEQLSACIIIHYPPHDVGTLQENRAARERYFRGRKSTG